MDQGLPAPVSPARDASASAAGQFPARLSVSILSYLTSRPGASPVALQRGLGICHRSQLTRLLTRLQARGYVDKDSNNQANAWSLTDHGRQILNQVQPVWMTHSPDARPRSGGW